MNAALRVTALAVEPVPMAAAGPQPAGQLAGGPAMPRTASQAVLPLLSGLFCIAVAFALRIVRRRNRTGRTREMRSVSMKKLLLTIVSLSAASGAMAGDKKPFERTETEEVTASVESVDPSTREMVLKGSQGMRVAMVAGPEVRNLEQIKPGDEVVAVYHQALAAQVKPRGTATAPPTAADTVERARPGEKPSGAAGVSVATTVQIESVDKSFNTVSFRRSDGIVRTVAVEDPDAQRFIRTLKPGDPVEIVYTEALAVSVVPAKQ